MMKLHVNTPEAVAVTLVDGVDVVLPSLYCPFPPTMNRHADATQSETLAWVRRHGLVPPTKMPAFERAKFARLAARAYPTASREALDLVACWNIWLFLHDDANDEASIGRDPERLLARHARLRQIMAGSPIAEADPPHVVAFADLHGRMAARGSEVWLERFHHSVDAYFQACVWEAHNRASGRVPPVDEYIAQRPSTGALETDIDLIEICEEIRLPQEVLHSSAVVSLMRLSNNAVCWANDVVSLPKELRAQDMHNLVIAIAHQHRIDWQQAIERAAAMHDAQVRRFEWAEGTLPSFGPGVDDELSRFVQILRAWMRGNLDWAIETYRYGVGTLQPAAARG